MKLWILLLIIRYDGPLNSACIDICSPLDPRLLVYHCVRIMMRAGRKVTDMYSVFVGHIHPDVSRKELTDLFNSCGEVGDVVILESPAHSYNYGFVRYLEKEIAFRAVKEINRWVLKGVELVVDISKDTVAKIKRENDEQTCKPKLRDGIVNQEKQRDRPSNTTLFLQDTMYLNRLKEKCSTLQVNGTGIVKSDYLFEDIGRAPSERFPTVWGSHLEPSVSFEHISQKIMKKCVSSSEVDPTFGEKKTAEFLLSLETIIKEINGVLGDGKLGLDKAIRNGKETLESVPNDRNELTVKQSIDEEQADSSENESEECAPNHCERFKGDYDTTSAVKQEPRRVCEQVLDMHGPNCTNIRCGDKREETNRMNSSRSLSDYCKDISYKGSLYARTRLRVPCLRENASKCKDFTNLETGEPAVSDNEYDEYTCSANRNRRSEETHADLHDEKVNITNQTGFEDHEDADFADDADKDALDNSREESSEKEVEPDVFDSAILDYHLSRLQERQKKESIECEPVNLLDKLFDNISVRKVTCDPMSGPVEMVRSVSRDSSMSGESNEGNVDDSGVESDFVSAHGMRSEAFRNNMDVSSDGVMSTHYGRPFCPGRKSFPESSPRSNLNPSVTSGKTFDLEEYVLRNQGRGRGILSGQTKAPVARGGVFSLIRFQQNANFH